jgi:hypothetical protein
MDRVDEVRQQRPGRRDVTVSRVLEHALEQILCPRFPRVLEDGVERVHPLSCLDRVVVTELRVVQFAHQRLFGLGKAGREARGRRDAAAEFERSSL